ncbi:hypothetical protein J2T25_002560 [Citrobacter amalonaticus]|uniref:gp53-like domain-containing protein n=1 Tax=Citrobacter amalonaticus TaxID=35703 RepID=UPI00209EC240|nr:hypothetical protein [Citrobacter amalonaticus]MCP1629609.1 hypothetical protein [Citrobacter amalonaticus]
MLRIGQVETTATSDGLYTDGSVAGGIAATRLRAAAFNAMQEELAHIVEEGGDALSIDDMTQVLKALKKLFLSRSNPFGDIALDGPEAIALALSNLGLGAAAKRDVGTGGNQIPDMSSFGRSALSPTTQGYFSLPSGIIVQWGTIEPLSSDVTTTLPIPFPTAFLAIISSSGYTPGAGTGGISYIGTSLASANRTTFTSRNSSPTLGGRYLALGY